MVNKDEYHNASGGGFFNSAAGANAPAAAASVLNNVVNNLFQSGVIKQQKQVLELQQKLMLLDSSQQNLLNQQLAQTNDKNAQLQILTSGVAQVDIAQINAASTSQTKTAILIIAGAFLFVVSIYLIKRSHGRN